jgi:hypothetical protein
VIHVATVHWRTPRWIEVQLRYLARNTSAPYRTYACLTEIDEEYARQFDVAIESTSNRHTRSLNQLAALIVDSADDDDWLVFLDGDAFPIADWVPIAERRLGEYPLLAVRRDDNLGDPHPHPCFCVTTVGFWKQIGGDWSTTPSFRNAEGRALFEPGARLLRALEERGTEWYPILRTNTRNPHPLFFGVYGDIVYHHGAAFRTPISRADMANAPPARHVHLPGRAAFVWRRRRRNRRLSKEMFERLSRDERFYRELTG